MRDESGLNIIAYEKGPKCKDPNGLDIMLYVTGWGLATCGTAMCCQLSGEICYLHLQTQNDWSHVTAEIPSWCRDRHVVRASPLTGSLVCLLSEVKTMCVTIHLLHTERMKELWYIRNSKYAVSKPGRNRGQL